MDPHDHRPGGARRPLRSTVVRLALVLLLVAASGLLVPEHRAHLLGSWPLLLFLGVCNGAHFLMHRCHGQAVVEFGDGYPRYAEVVPRFIPRMSRRITVRRDHG